MSGPIICFVVCDLEDSNFGVFELFVWIGVVTCVMVLGILLNDPVTFLPFEGTLRSIHVHLGALALSDVEVWRWNLVV